LGYRSPANGALLLSGADDRTATATHCWPSGIPVVCFFEQMSRYANERDAF